MKKVLVRWYDTEALRGWKTKRVMKKIVKEGLDVAETVGLLFEDNDDIVAVVQSHHVNNFSELLMIPKACVISVEVLKKEK